MAIDLQYLTTHDLTLSLETAKLEQKYQAALRQAERIYEEERVRALRVQLLLSKDDNDELHDQMQACEDEMQKLEQTNDDLHDRLSAAESDLQSAQINLKAQSREVDRYKAETNALNTASSDATRLLSEKLTLSRELATLKPEFEHLKSQAAYQQNVLAEKLALERELSTAQVELETERRTVQRMRTQDKTSGHGESVMLDEIESLKKELAKEKRQLQKQQREQLNKAAEWDSQKEIIEGKLDAFRTKLRTTKEQLKEAQDELEKAQTAKFARATEAAKERMHGTNPKKRNVARFDPDMTIGTPGNGGPAKKQRMSVVPGDKSSFSITPFLNRTMSILPESPSETVPELLMEKSSMKQTTQEPSTEEEVEEQPETEVNVSKKKPVTARSQPPVRKTTTEPLKENTNPKTKRAAKKSTLAKVTEEHENEAGQEHGVETLTEPINISSTLLPTTTIAATIAATTSTATNLGKRKLNTNRPTIFDDDDEADAPPPKRTAKKLMNLSSLRGGLGSNNSGGAKGPSTLGGGSLNKISLGGIGGKNKVLAEFSPLKKDRRMVV